MKRLVLVPLVGLALMACDDDPIGASQTARVRIVNAASTNASIGAYLGSTKLGADVTFQAASACNTITVPAGQRVISFRNLGSVTQIASVQGDFEAGHDYLVVLLAGPPRALVFDEHPFATTTGTNNAIRVVNATPTTGDAYTTTAGGTPVTAIPLASGGSSGGPVYRELAANVVQVRIFNSGETSFTTPRASHTLASTGTARTSTVFLTPAAAPATATGFQVNRCV